jgi:hypothetical protein
MSKPSSDKERMERSVKVRDSVVGRREAVVQRYIGNAADRDSILQALQKVHCRQASFDIKLCLADMVVHQHKVMRVLLEELAALRMRTSDPVTVLKTQKEQS